MIERKCDFFATDNQTDGEKGVFKKIHNMPHESVHDLGSSASYAPFIRNDLFNRY